MKKKLLFLTLLVSVSTLLSAQWKPAGNKIKTKWAETIDPQNVLPEYPRPIMERNDWTNLNGLWDYAVLPVGAPEPGSYSGKILVPFAIESSLSGIQQELGKEKELWYKRSFSIPSGWNGKNILLHFGAVDWKADVFVNDIQVGTHTGGYTPFCFDITPYLTSGEQKLVVRVWDPTDDGYQARGKQINKPEGIWYTPVSGIWQTVWLEPVNNKYISDIRATPDIDTKRLSVELCTKNTNPANIAEIIVKDGNKTITKNKFAACQKIEIPIPNAKLWSPESPFLYDIEINLYDNGKVVDKIKSYAAMRKVSTKRDDKGIVRLQLNNKDYFHFGPLDQGWWPDGLYTAPTDEALLYDIQKTKDFGYNMIRKHVKVEPARWYTYCDKIGLLVWQDMPNGNYHESPKWQMRQFFNDKEMIRSATSEADYRKEWKEIIDYLYSYPSIAVWVPFNEAWGQFKTVEIAEWTKNYDPSRLVNPASGGNHYRTGDILDIHHYPGPELTLYEHDSPQSTVLGEYGGIGLPLQGHLWQPDKNWGYVQFKNSKEVTDEYIKYGEELKNLAKRGYSAAVYTQTTDVEGEINGLITYDRKIIKLEEPRLRAINQQICNILNK
ncbi:MAG: glycoside hydrolase family 2 TIM barrel-domain containing protein [Dysgonomonas sp.]|nr:glycoside hydrolase family 2 TIM barrel-domain containing protein [Dysgonomonas sp.]